MSSVYVLCLVVVPAAWFCVSIALNLTVPQAIAVAAGITSLCGFIVHLAFKVAGELSKEINRVKE